MVSDVASQLKLVACDNTDVLRFAEILIIEAAVSEIAILTAELSALRACEGTDTDTRPRYSMKRMRDEIAKAKEYARAEALEEAAIMIEARAGEYDAGFDETEYKTAYLAASAALMAIAASIRALMVKP